MSRSILLSALFMHSLCLVCSLHGQEQQVFETPSEVVQAYCDAITKQNRQLVLQTLDDRVIKPEGEILLAAIKGTSMPKNTALLRQLFEKPLDDAKLAQLTPRDALAAYLCGPIKNKERKYSSGTWSLDPNWMGGLSNPGTRKVIGVVDDGEDEHKGSDEDKGSDGDKEAYVVYRYEGMNPRPGEDYVNVVICVERENGWRVVPSWIKLVERVGYLSLLSAQAAGQGDEAQSPQRGAPIEKPAAAEKPQDCDEMRTKR